jgi:hypothetical protein
MMTTHRPVGLLEPLGALVLHGVELPVPGDVEGFLQAEYPELQTMQLPQSGMGPIIQKGTGDWDIKEHAKRHRERYYAPEPSATEAAEASALIESALNSYRTTELEREFEEMMSKSAKGHEEVALVNAGLSRSKLPSAVNDNHNPLVMSSNVYIGMHVERSWKITENDAKGIVIGYRHADGTVMGNMKESSSNATVSVTWADTNFGDEARADIYCMGHHDRFDLRWIVEPLIVKRPAPLPTTTHWMCDSHGKIVDGQPESLGGFAYCKNSRALQSGDIWTMRVDVLAGAIIGFTEESYDVNRPTGAFESAIKVSLGDGTTAIGSGLSVDGKYHVLSRHLYSHLPKTAPFNVAVRCNGMNHSPAIMFSGDDGMWSDWLDFVPPEKMSPAEARLFFPHLQLFDGERLTNHRVDNPA